MCLVLKKDQTKYANQKSSSNRSLQKYEHSNLCHFWWSALLKWAFERGSDFRAGMEKNCSNSKKQNHLDYFETDSLKEIDFLSDMPRTTFSRDCISTTI